LVARFQGYLRDQRILTPAQLDRMKGTELFSELLMSINNGGPINKKTALDRAIGNDSVNGNTLSRVSREFIATLNLVKRMFPEIKQTRFRNSVEFYSLFMLVWEMRSENLVLTERRRNKIAFELLRKLSTGVDELREQLKKATIRRTPQRLYSDYLLTVQGDTDSSANRERRREIIKGLLLSLYERKDEKRAFSPEQRRIIWNSDEKRLCARCHRPLSWIDYSVDHIVAHTRGGRTSLDNAQPMHRRCNSSKGARPVSLGRALAA
jgi:HNH endonuclease